MPNVQDGRPLAADCGRICGLSSVVCCLFGNKYGLAYRSNTRIRGGIKTSTSNWKPSVLSSGARNLTELAKLEFPAFSREVRFLPSLCYGRTDALFSTLHLSWQLVLEILGDSGKIAWGWRQRKNDSQCKNFSVLSRVRWIVVLKTSRTWLCGQN